MAAGIAALTLLFGGKVHSIELYAAEAEQTALENVCDGGIQTFGGKYVWYYKVVDGVKFMRLRDSSNGKWMTPWLLCSPLLTVNY